MKKYSLIAPEIHEIMDDLDFKQKIQDSFSDLHAYEVSTSLEGLEPFEIARILLALGIPKGVDIFEEFEDSDKSDIFLCFTLDERVTYIEEMSHDERIDLLKILPENIQNQVYRRIDQSDRDDIKKLMIYEEGSVGSLVTTAYASVKQDDSVKEALAHLRKTSLDKETIYYVYVVDKENRLLGLVSLRELIIAAPSTLIKNIMSSDVVSLCVEDDQEGASKLIRDYDLIALPAVDEKGVLVGIVTVDDLVDVVIEENTEDILNLGAAGKHVPYLSSSVLTAASQRGIWLFILICVGFVSGYVLERYQFIFDSVMPLVFFIPLLCASAGNAGTQSATIVIRELATDGIDLEDIWRVLRKEFLIGILLGVGLGLMAAIRAFFFDSQSDLGLKMGMTVGASMILVIIFSTSCGAILPIMFKKLNLDPALMSGPLISSLVDICCLLTYLEIARFIFHL
jgi:magnesium transporter